MSDPVSLAEARNSLGDLVNRASYAGERVVLERRGKPVAAVVSIGDLETLEALEDEMDNLAYEKARAEWEADGRKTISHKQLLAQLDAKNARED